MFVNITIKTKLHAICAPVLILRGKNKGCKMKNIFFLRFPHLVQSIFEILDDENLIKCKTVSRSWSSYMDEERFFWKRIIKKLVHDYDDFRKEWIVAMKKADIEMIKELGCAVQKIFSGHSSQCVDKENCKHLTIQISPLYLCAEFGLVTLCKFLLPISEDKNPKNKAADGWTTPIHVAAAKGNVEVYEELMNYVKDKDTVINEHGFSPLHGAASNGLLELFLIARNYTADINPATNLGVTPLHYAANGGHLNVCKKIMEHLEDKNPRGNFGNTPLHLAAINRHIDVCRYIMSQISDKYPRNDDDFTPLHEAAERGNFDVCKYITDQSIIKNPRYFGGNTALHLAAVHGHSRIFAYIMKRVTNKNIADDWGYTPLHGAAEFGHVEICKLILNKVQNKNPKDHNGETPLDLAKKKSPMDHDGTTPLDLARENNYDEIIQMLIMKPNPKFLKQPKK